MNKVELQEIKDDAYAKSLFNHYTTFLQIQQKLIGMMGNKWKQCSQGTPNKFKEADKDLVNEMKSVLEYTEELLRKQQDQVKELLEARQRYMREINFLTNYNSQLLNDNYQYNQEKEIHTLNQIAKASKSKPLVDAIQQLKKVTLLQHQLDS